MAKQTKQRTVKYPPKQGNLSRREVKQAVREVVDASRKTGSTRSTNPPKTPSKPKNTK